MAVISSSPQQHVESVSSNRHLPPVRSTATFVRLLLTLGMVVCDSLAFYVSFLGVYTWKMTAIRESGLAIPEDPVEIFLILVAVHAAFLFTFAINGLYHLRRGASRVDEAYKVFSSISLAIVLTLVLHSLLPWIGSTGIPLTATLLVLIWLATIVFTIFLRLFYRYVIYWLRIRGIDTQRVIIVGAREPGRAIWRTIRHTPALGYRVQGFLSDVRPVGSRVDGLPVLGRLNQLERVVRVTLADEVFIALTNRSQHELMDIVSLAEDQSVSIRVYPDTFQLITNNEVSIGDLDGLPLVSVRNAALDHPVNQALKRVLDLVFSISVLVILSPVLLIIALLIKLDSPGPVFFLQERVGMDGKPFCMIKFRTMRTDSESRGPGWTVANDPRVTRLGAYLRRYSIDELPQFINVLFGEMSVVGPRPEQPKWVERFSQEIPRYMRRHKEKAGITGWAQVNGLRGDTSIEERTRYDLYYVENWSLLFDIRIILRTAADILLGKQENAY